MRIYYSNAYIKQVSRNINYAFHSLLFLAISNAIVAFMRESMRFSLFHFSGKVASRRKKLFSETLFWRHGSGLLVWRATENLRRDPCVCGKVTQMKIN